MGKHVICAQRENGLVLEEQERDRRSVMCLIVKAGDDMKRRSRSNRSTGCFCFLVKYTFSCSVRVVGD